MTKVNFKKISTEERKEILEDLFNILRIAENKKDVIDLVIGGLTDSEIIMLSNRLNVAKMLFEGCGEREIRKRVGVGYSTIVTVNNLLNRNGDRFSKVLKKYFKEIYGVESFKFRKNKLYNYPGYEFAAKILGIEFIDKMIQKK